MPNEITRILDTITPEIYNAYMDKRTSELSAFVQSGIAVSDEKVSKNITAGGLLVNMPYWNDLSGEDEVLDDGEEGLSTAKITSKSDIAAVLYRGRGWAVNELAKVVAGSDPLKSFMDKLASYWSRREQAVLISVLNGLFNTKTGEETVKGALVDTHVYDISGGSGAAAKISGGAVLDTKQLLGDAAGRIKGMGIHSAVYTELQKQQLIEFIQVAGTNIRIPYYLEYALTIDDGLPVIGSGTNRIFTSYLFGTGAIGRNSGTPADLTTYETARDASKGNDEVFTRRALTMHPYGIKWIGDPAGVTPSNAELADPANWNKVYDNKDIALLALKHKI